MITTATAAATAASAAGPAEYLNPSERPIRRMGKLPDVVKGVTRLGCELKDGKLECGVITTETGKDTKAFERSRDDRWIVDEAWFHGANWTRLAPKDQMEAFFKSPATCEITRKKGEVRLDCE